MENTKKISGIDQMGNDNGMDKGHESVLREEVGDDKSKNIETGAQADIGASADVKMDTAWRMANPFARMSRLSRLPPRERCGSFGDAEEMIRRLRRENEKEAKSSACKEKKESIENRRRGESRALSSTTCDNETESEANVLIIERESDANSDSSYAELDEANEGRRKRRAKSSPKQVFHHETSMMKTLRDQSTRLVDFTKKNKNVHEEVKNMAADIASLVKQCAREYKLEQDRRLDLEEEVKSMRKRQKQLEKEVNELKVIIQGPAGQSEFGKDRAEGTKLVREKAIQTDIGPWKTKRKK